jgi:hypothetical protein
MSIFERFTNPVWHRVSALDSSHQLIAALMISGYGMLRQALKENLVEPLEKSGLVSQGSLNPDVREQLIDEAAIGLMKSLQIPESDPNGKLPSRVLSALPQVWGTFALADKSNRLKHSESQLLKDTQYSVDADEARTQVLVEWNKILRSAQPNFVMEANKRWFFRAWAELSVAYMGGTLIAFGRIPQEILLKKARSLSEAIPAHRIPKTISLIEIMAKAPLTVEPNRGVSQKPAIPKNDGGDARSNLSAQRLHGVLEHADGKADIRLAPDADPLEVIRAMFVVMQPMIARGKDAAIWENWASSVTGVRILNDKWTPEHIDAVVRGMERFCWDGDGGQQFMTKLVREKYAHVKGTRIDIQLTDEIRARFRDMLTEKKK